MRLKPQSPAPKNRSQDLWGIEETPYFFNYQIIPMKRKRSARRCVVCGARSLARAIENGAFVIAAAQAGLHEDGRVTFGHSIIIDPWGKVLAMAGGAGEEIIFAEIDTSLVAAARGKIPNLRNAREFGLDTVIPAGGEAA